MNVKLLRKVKRHILEEPKRFGMDHWAAPSSASPCGTVACIAGWTVILTERGKPLNIAKRLGIGMFSEYLKALGTRRVATEKLGIDDEQAKRLFYVSEWPSDFRGKYFGSPKASRVTVAAARIDHFIKTKGAE